MKAETIHEYLLRRLDFAAGQHNTIAKESGVGQATVSRIFRRECVPRLDKAQALIDWFDRADSSGKKRRSRVNPGSKGGAIFIGRKAGAAAAAVAE